MSVAVQPAVLEASSGSDPSNAPPGPRQPTFLPAVAGDPVAPGGWVTWRGGDVFACWPEVDGRCAGFVRVWTDPDSTGPCRPDAAAFVDLTRLVLRCGADGIGVLVERSGRAQPWVRDTVSSNDVRPRRPVVGTCSPRGRRVVADDRGSPVLAPCTPATLERSAVCPARGGDAATTPPRPVAVARARPPHFAGLQLDLYFEFSAQRSAQRRIEDMRPASDRAIDRGLTVVAGVRVGFDPTARPRWQRVHAAVERRRRARAADAAIRPRGCAREGQRR